MAQQKLTHQPRGRVVPQRRNRSRLPLILLGVALVLLVAGGFAISQFSEPSVTVSPFTPSPINAPTGTTPEGFAFKGSDGAPVTVIEYGDFQCPSCGAFATSQEAAFDAQYVDTGKVRFVYHDFPLPQHQNAIIAAAAARAAGEQGKFWEMHELLFVRQRAWSNSSNPEALMTAYAAALGLDQTAFKTALTKPEVTAALQQAAKDSTARGVQATPTFEVDGKLVSSAELNSAVEAALQAKGQ